MKRYIVTHAFILVSTVLISANLVAEQNSTSYRNAIPINVNERYTGALTSDYYHDKDWYSFTLANDGKITITFNSEMMDDNMDYYNIFVFNATNPDNQLYSRSVNGYSIETTTMSLGLPAGNYYMVIQSSSYQYYSSEDYSFVVNYAESDSWEKEFNNTWRMATRIDLDRPYFGALSSDYDHEQDWYAFTLENDGKINIRFKSRMMNNNDGYYHIVVCNALNPDDQLCNKRVYGYTTETEMLSLGLPAGNYYMVIQSSSYQYYSSEDYSFVVNYAESDSWEKEFNDTWRMATRIDLNRPYFGALSSDYDHEQDWYIFTLNAEGKICITFDSKMAGDNEAQYKVAVCSQKNPDKALLNHTIYGYSSRTEIPTLELPAGTYLFKVQSASYQYFTHEDYGFTIGRD